MRVDVGWLILTLQIPHILSNGSSKKVPSTMPSEDVNLMECQIASKSTERCWAILR